MYTPVHVRVSFKMDGGRGWEGAFTTLPWKELSFLAMWRATKLHIAILLSLGPNLKRNPTYAVYLHESIRRQNTNYKAYTVCEYFVYQVTAILLGMFLFWVRIMPELWLAHSVFPYA